MRFSFTIEMLADGAIVLSRNSGFSCDSDLELHESREAELRLCSAAMFTIFD